MATRASSGLLLSPLPWLHQDHSLCATSSRRCLIPLQPRSRDKALDTENVGWTQSAHEMHPRAKPPLEKGTSRVCTPGFARQAPGTQGKLPLSHCHRRWERGTEPGKQEVTAASACPQTCPCPRGTPRGLRQSKTRIKKRKKTPRKKKNRKRERKQILKGKRRRRRV